LRDVLGDHANQAGSLVEPGRIRFDFSHFAQVAVQELGEVEAEVNQRLYENTSVRTTITTKQEAEEMGALAFFGDKYGEVVRVVQVGEFSTEFCGGTHTSTSAQVGPLLLLSESSIGSNLRRVEALTGMAAYDHLVSERDTLHRAGALLKTSARDVPSRLEQLLERVSGLESELDAIRKQRHGSVAEELAASSTVIGEHALVVGTVEDVSGNELREIALGVRDRIDRPSVVIIGTSAGGKGALVGLVSKDLVSQGVSASDLISDAARTLGGGGSRDPELAQAGGPNGSEIDSAMDVARAEAERALASL
jgi:alanyl-tRNA synthetase